MRVKREREEETSAAFPGTAVCAECQLRTWKIRKIRSLIRKCLL